MDSWLLPLASAANRFHEIRVVLDVDSIDYSKLKRAVNQNLPFGGLLGRIAKAGISGVLGTFGWVDSVDSSTANSTVCDLLNTFDDRILSLLNEKASEFGIRVSDISFQMNGSKIRAVAQVHGVLDAVNKASSDFGLTFSDISISE